MDIILSKKDTEWITTQYPGLTVDLNEKTIVGDIGFLRSYNDYVIEDTYSIKVVLETPFGSILPKVYELSTKIQDTAIRYNKKNLEDLHINAKKDNSFCLSIYQKENECFESGFTIQEFFEKCLEEFLFWQSYYAKFGKAPWDEYAHGTLGLVELYAENGITLSEIRKQIDLKELSRYVYHYDCIHDKCLCGEAKSMKKCHPLIHKGIEKIKSDLIY